MKRQQRRRDQAHARSVVDAGRAEKNEELRTFSAHRRAAPKAIGGKSGERRRNCRRGAARPQEAERCVEQAKRAESWDGKIVHLTAAIEAIIGHFRYLESESRLK